MEHRFPLSGTDADAVFRQRGGIPTAALGIPNRYMHSPIETIHLGDLETLAGCCTTSSPVYRRRTSSRSKSNRRLPWARLPSSSTPATASTTWKRRPPFYKDVLGLEQVSSHTSPRGSSLVFFKVPNSEELIEISHYPKSGPVRVDPDLTHLAFEVDDLKAFAEEAAKKGYPLSDGRP